MKLNHHINWKQWLLGVSWTTAWKEFGMNGVYVFLGPISLGLWWDDGPSGQMLNESFNREVEMRDVTRS